MAREVLSEEQLAVFDNPKTPKLPDGGGVLVSMRKSLGSRLLEVALALGVAVGFSGQAFADTPAQKTATEEKDTQTDLLQVRIDKSLEALKDKWGVTVKYKDFKQFLRNHQHEGNDVTDLEKIANVLDVLLKNFEETYPSPLEKLVQRNHLTIYLVDSLMVVKGKEKGPVGGFQNNDKKGHCDIVIDITDLYIDEEASTMDHEFVHRLDTTDTAAWATRQIFVKSTNRHGSDEYQFPSGTDAIIKDWKRLPDNDDFPSEYARNGGPLEDVADLGTKMMNASTIVDIVRRAQKSEFMRKKFIMVFGCDIDEQGKIVDLTLDEYKEKTKFKSFKLPGWRYFKRWSDIDGKIRMDAAYWQKILDKGWKLEEEKRARIEAEKVRVEQEERELRQRQIKRTTIIRERNPLARASMVSSPGQLFFHLYPAHGVNPLKDDKKPVTVPPIIKSPH